MVFNRNNHLSPLVIQNIMEVSNMFHCDLNVIILAKRKKKYNLKMWCTRKYQSVPSVISIKEVGRFSTMLLGHENTFRN